MRLTYREKQLYNQLRELGVSEEHAIANINETRELKRWKEQQGI